ncbi:hypothetical protein [Sphingomonas sp. R86520]|uniref:hypothetical protein n=1 Tax=Sphingomonas sp. R86520 TaxID=3093859 RepID=UPI0036D3CA96
MDAEKFVASLRDLVAAPAADGTLTQIERPSGRNVAADRKERAAWLAALSSEDRAHVEYAVREAANAAVFGLLCVLDGARVIEDGPRGHLELHYQKDGSDTLLSSSDLSEPAPSLHELF